MKNYSTPILRFTKFANDESIIASKPEGTTSAGETPEESFPQGEITPSPENPFV